MSEWQPIETAPKDKTDILVLSEGRVVEAYWEGSRSRGYWDSFFQSYESESLEPTHWMPLPAPPNKVTR